MNNIDIKNDIENIQSEINHTFKSIEDLLKLKNIV